MAYAMLLERHTGAIVDEVRIRYHASNITVRVPATDEGRADVIRAVARARQLATVSDRPPVTDDERKCVRCSLAPVCLPEEARLAELTHHAVSDAAQPVRLYPPDTERRALHVVSQRAKIGRSGERA